MILDRGPVRLCWDAFQEVIVDFTESEEGVESARLTIWAGPDDADPEDLTHFVVEYSDPEDAHNKAEEYVALCAAYQKSKGILTLLDAGIEILDDHHMWQVYFPYIFIDGVSKGVYDHQVRIESRAGTREFVFEEEYVRDMIYFQITEALEEWHAPQEREAYTAEEDEDEIEI